MNKTNGATIVPANFEHVVIANETMKTYYFYWHNDEPNWEPVAVDPTTATMLVAVHGALDRKSQDRFELFIANSRMSFAQLVQLGWKSIHPIKNRG